MLHFLLVLYVVVAVATPVVLHFIAGAYDGVCDVNFQKTITDVVVDKSFWPQLFLMTIGWPIMAGLFFGWAVGRALDTDRK